MKKLLLILLMAASALPVVCQIAGPKSEVILNTDRKQKVATIPLKSNDGNVHPLANSMRSEVYYWGFESDESLNGWRPIDNDHDGYSWSIDYENGRNGGTCVFSASYANSVGSLNPDNWLITPAVVLDGTLSLWARNYSAAYPDKFAVYICLDNYSNVSDFVKISDDIIPSDSYEEYTFDMTPYAGQYGYVAIRHYDSYNQYYLFIDDISINGYPVEKPKNVNVTTTSSTAEVVWEDGVNTTWNLRYREVFPGVNNNLLWDFEDSYDNGSLPGGWTCIDSDGDGYKWYHLNGYIGMNAHRGLGHVTSASYVVLADSTTKALTPDNWLVSPQVKLDGELSFWARGQDPKWASEVFRVYCSTDKVNWEPLSDDITATGEMTEYTFDMTPYAGQYGYVAIRHYNVTDMFRLNIDDIAITYVKPAEWIYVNNLNALYYTIEGLTPGTNYEVQVQSVGSDQLTSNWTESVLFTSELEQTAAPSISYYISEDGYVVSIMPHEESDIYYRIIKDYSEYGDWKLYTDELLFSEDGSYYIEAYAKAEGKSASYVVGCMFNVYGYQKTDPPIITYNTTDDAVIVTATGNGEVKLFVNDVQVENPFSIPRTDVDQVYYITATAQEEGKQVSETAYMEVSVPAKEGSSDGLSIYVKAYQAPYLYSWDSSGSLCGDWPGTRLTEKVTINRVEYYVYHFDKNMVNVIFNNGGSNQTGDFTNITHDAYFIYDGQDLAYGLIPPQVYGNPSGEYAFYVNTDGWSQVYADVNGYTYPMTKVGVDGAGFEVYKWEVPSLSYTPTTITFNDGAGNCVQDAYGNTYSSAYVKGGYYVYSFFMNYYYVRLDMVTTILYDDSSQRPALEDCTIEMISTNDVWNGYNDVEFQVSGTYFSQQARQGSVWYSVDDREWVKFTPQLNSEEQFEETITVDFSSPWKSPIHSIRLAAKDVSGAFSDVVTVLEAIDAEYIRCESIPEAEYTGQPITFNPVFYDENGRTLIQGEDYTYSYLNNVNAGIALLIFEAIYPLYLGSSAFDFTIRPHTILGDVHLAGGENQYYYTGSPIRPEVIVVDETFDTLHINQDYVVSYIDNEEVGTATAIVEGIGNFTGHFELQFEIIGIPGDVNYTGTIDITDLQAMVKYIFGEYNKPFNFVAADLNQDNTVNVQDVVGEANLLLTGELVPMTSGSRRLSVTSNATQASLYWEDGVLYLNSTVPVAALDIVNSVDDEINWNLGARGMIVLNASSAQGQHSVIYSLNDVVIPAGLTAIATTTCQQATVVAAMLSDADAELIQVKYNDSMTGLTDIHGANGIRCDMVGSKLVINSDAALHDIDVTIYSIDGRIVSNKHLAILNSGQTSIEMNDIIDSNRYLIIVVRYGRQILATQKLTQNK